MPNNASGFRNSLDDQTYMREKRGNERRGSPRAESERTLDCCSAERVRQQNSPAGDKLDNLAAEPRFRARGKALRRFRRLPARRPTGRNRMRGNTTDVKTSSNCFAPLIPLIIPLIRPLRRLLLPPPPQPSYSSSPLRRPLGRAWQAGQSSWRAVGRPPG